MDKRWFRHVFLFLMTWHLRFVVRASTREEAFDTTCTDNSDCTAIAYSTCQVFNVTSSDGTDSVTNENICACDAENGFVRYVDSCVMPVGLGDRCDDDTTICNVTGSECVLFSGIHPTMLCQCSGDTKEVELEDGSFACGTIITRYQDPECIPCEDNEGECYDLNADGLRDGCLCPISLTGEDCDVIHVFVECDVNGFNMKICYDPHEQIDFDNGAKMYTEGYGEEMACRGMPAEEGECEQGTYKLLLPLDDSERDTCGTQKFTIGDTLKYENRIYADSGGMTPTLIIFNTYCSYRISAALSSSGMGVIGQALASSGQDLLPTIHVHAYDSLDRELPHGVALRLGEGIQYEFDLLEDGHYGAIHIESCAFSSSSTSGNPNAAYLPLVTESCPDSAQTLVDSSNTWHQVNGMPSRLKSGPVPLIRLSSGSVTFLHCVVRLCRVNDMQKCDPAQCPGEDDMPFMGNGRRRRRSLVDRKKRSGDEDEADFVHVSRALHIWDDGSVQSTEFDYRSQFMFLDPSEEYIILERDAFIVCVLLIGFLLIAMIATIACLMKKYSQGSGQVPHQKLEYINNTGGMSSVPVVSQPNFYQQRLPNNRI